jgi:hypothetical protein
MAKIEELAARVFAARDAAHRAHWKTGSFAAHMALGEFYDSVIDEVDAVVEVYQGAFGLIGPFSVTSEPPANLVGYLEAETKWIEENRDDFANGNTAVGNLVDSLIGVYRRTLYKLTNLA